MRLFGKKEDRKEEVQPQPQANPVNVAPRPQRSAAMLNSQQLARTQEALRLAQTKLTNIEENLERLRDQQEWLRRYKEVQMELAQEKTRLYDLNRQVSSMIGDETALKRFETFEAILPTFLKMQMLEKRGEENRQALLQLERETKQQQEQWAVQQKVQQQTTDKRQQAETMLYQTQDRVMLGCRLEAANETIQGEKDYLENQKMRLAEQIDTLSGSMKEHAANIDTLRKQIDEVRAKRQSLEMHRRMLKREDTVLLRLDRMQEIESEVQQLRNLQAEAVRRKDEEKELLQRILVQFQDVMSEIDTVTEEMKRQRLAIQGQTTAKLLERAMSLKSRLQMLLSAQSLWSRISAGYNLIEETSQALNALRLHIEHNETNLRALETEVANITRLTREKEYTYLLSKSQNVIQLRADLVEGVSCSVCGATHHPYHSDSMLEQSKLIGEFKTDYEQLAVESRNKQDRLTQLRQELADQRGRRQILESSLSRLEQRQDADVREWQVFSSLDRTFSDCSPSTNLDARQAMLCQLIEKTTQDADAAQSDLENFNYHRDTLNELSERLQILEQRKNELNTRMAEVNTSSQVTAGKIENIQQQLEAEDRHYSAVYDELEQFISIPDWLRDWKVSPESVKGRIQQYASQWREADRQITERKVMLQTEEETLAREQALHSQARQTYEATLARIDTCQGRMAENLKTHEQQVGMDNAKVLFLTTHEKKLQAQAAEQDEETNTQRMQREVERAKGREDNYQQQAAQIAEALAFERSTLDHWIKHFNQHNPPVQYAELDEVFRQGKDWNELRARLSATRTAHALSQARVDELNSRLVALQAEGGTSAADTESLQVSVIAQRQTLLDRRNQLMLQIARLTATLEEHQQAEKVLGSPEHLIG